MWWKGSSDVMDTIVKSTEPKLGLRPLDDRVIVRQDEANDKSKGGILLPDSAREKPRKGTVVAVGPGKFCPELLRADPLSSCAGMRIPMPVKAGDRVLYSSWSGNEVPDHDDLTIMRLDDIMAIVDE